MLIWNGKGKTKEENQACDEGQSVLNKEEVEEVDFLQPYLHLLSPSLIELLRFCETTRARNTYLTREVVLLEKHITNLQSINRRLMALLESKVATTSSPSPAKEDNWALVWAIPLACAKLGGVAPVSYHHHIFCIYLCFSFPFQFSLSLVDLKVLVF